MNVRRSERGQMLIMTAFELTLLIGFLALAGDVGVLFHSKRHMQIAADAAATAAVMNDYNGGVNATGFSNTQAAINAASANGYTDGKDGVNVTVNQPPASGYHKTAGYVEVIVSKPDPLYFFKFLTGNSTTTVAARAVAGDPEGAPGCMYFLAEQGTGMYLQGSSNIYAANCGIYVNSTTSDAIYSNDQGNYVDAEFIHTPGGLNKFQTSPTPTQTASSGSSVPQNFQNLPVPDPATICQPPTYDSSGNETSPGNIYDYGATTSTVTYANVTGDTLNPVNEQFTSLDGSTSSYADVYCFDKPVTFGTSDTSVTNLPDGFYVFEDGFTLQGQVNFGNTTNTVQGTDANGNPITEYVGATIYNYGGQIAGYNNGNDQMSIIAPTIPSSVFNSVAIYQPALNTSTIDIQFGSSNSTMASCSSNPTDSPLDGYIYAPTAQVYLHDQGGGILVAGIIADNLYEKSSTITICNYNLANQSTTPLRVISLVE